MKILMFAPAFAPFANPEAIVNSKLALAFLAAGWEVDVISRNLQQESEYNYGSGWVEPWLPLRAVTHEVRYPTAGGRPGRILDTLCGGLKMRSLAPGCRWAAHAVALARELARDRRYDAVLSRSGPEAAHLAALAFVQQARLPWVANWNDPSAEKMPPPCGRGEERKRRPREDRLRSRVAAAASWHTFPCERLRAHMTRYLGPVAAARSSVIPHVALPGAAVTGVRDPSRFVLCHAGNLGYGRDAGPFLEGFARFVRQERARDRARLVLIGAPPGELQGRIQAADLAGLVEVRGSLGYLATLDALAASDVNVVIEAPCAEGIFLPSKVVDCVQAGRPLLAVSPRRGTLVDLIGERGGGIHAACDEPEAIARAIAELFNSRNEGALEQRYGSNVLAPVFSPAAVVDAWRRIFDERRLPEGA